MYGFGDCFEFEWLIVERRDIAQVKGVYTWGRLLRCASATPSSDVWYDTTVHFHMSQHISGNVIVLSLH